METPQHLRRTEPDPDIDRVARCVIGAAINVHRALGPAYLEAVYAAALAIELRAAGLAIETQQPFTITYRGAVVGQGRLDLIVEGSLIVELKTVDALAPIHVAQLKAYLAATDLRLGLLLNFRVPLMRDGVRRVVRT